MLKLDEGSERAGETGRGQQECDEHQRPCVRVVMRGEGEITLKKKKKAWACLEHVQMLTGGTL